MQVTTRVTISNSTITKNLTGVSGNGYAAEGQNPGGGIYLTDLDALSQDNRNCPPPYVQILPADWSPTVEVSNSIIAGNSVLKSGNVNNGAMLQTNNCYGSLTSLAGRGESLTRPA